MQKNVPRYTPDFVETVTWWAETSKRDVRYAVCNDRRTLLWFANQRAVEYHPAGHGGASRSHHPPRARPRSARGLRLLAVVAVAHLVRQALDDLGLAGALKTSGAKGLHIFVPDRRRRAAGGLRRGPARDRGAGRAPRPVDRDHRVRQGRPRGQGVRRLDAGGRGHGRRRVQSASATGRTRRSRSGGTNSTTCSRRTSPSTPRSTRSPTATRGPSTCPRRTTSAPT